LGLIYATWNNSDKTFVAIQPGEPSYLIVARGLWSLEEEVYPSTVELIPVSQFNLLAEKLTDKSKRNKVKVHRKDVESDITLH